MNVQALEQTSVIPTLCVTTLKDPTSVVVLVVTLAMEETAQVNQYYSRSTCVIIALVRRIGDQEFEACICTCIAVVVVLCKGNTAVLEQGT